jgi:hypothetical protein
MPGEREKAIRERVAYAIWEEEGRPDGKALDHLVERRARAMVRRVRLFRPISE